MNVSPTVRNLVSSALLVAGLFSCTHRPPLRPGAIPGTPEAEPTFVGPAENHSPLGPPAPEQVFGPQANESRRVVLFLGPGAPAALGAAGVIRALDEAKIEVAGIVAMEMGALVGAAYATAGNVNGMDWRLLQFKPEWITPSKGLSAMLGTNRGSGDRLRDGMKKLFPSAELAATRRPLWIVVDRGRGPEAVGNGPVAPLLVGTLTQREVITPGEEGESPRAWGPIRELLEREGLDLPGVWVVPRISSAWPVESARRAAQEAGHLVRPGDLLIELEPGQPWDFSRRSDLIYAGKKKCRTALPEWRASLGWDGAAR